MLFRSGDVNNPVARAERVNDFNGLGAQADDAGWMMFSHRAIGDIKAAQRRIVVLRC